MPSKSFVTLRARKGGYMKAARHSPEELTGPARKGFMARFEREALALAGCPLSDEELRRRAKALLCAHMAGIRAKGK